MEQQLIKIGGGGVASLSCAINLRLAGFDVLIYEKNQDAGWHRHNDWQGLENWTNDEDVLEFLRRINIKVNFPNHPCFEAIGLDADLNRYPVKSQKPLFYLIKRGLGLNSFDQYLKKQAEEIGVQFEFNKSVKPEEAEIIGTGRRNAEKFFGMALGITFETDLPNTVLCLLDNNIAPQAYAYLIVVNNQATLAACFITLKKHLKAGRQHLEEAIKQFQKVAGFSIQNPRYFSGSANLGFIKDKSRIYIGEAGGLQDGFLGFGMRYALLSGYLAAQSIVKSSNYQAAAKIYWQTVEKEIYPIIRTSIVNRFIYEFFTNKTYKWLLGKISKKTDIRKFVQKQYQPAFYKNLLFPIIKLKSRKYLIH
ncbi:MAG: NAD(P)/FAD-dependent oxidoreductase [Candidatus Nealsonbacteria bacterium]|nr:NAD(P)/FAD-dependent oxidoreductase [Candidatus Nealsonbacteria bacterium]